MNPLFNSLGNPQDIINRFNQFRGMFNGDPRQQVQQLLNSGKVSQSQYNDAVNKANELFKMLHGAHM